MSGNFIEHVAKDVKADFFKTTFFKFNNKNIALDLKKYIKSLNTKGIESNIAPQLKHNLKESTFDFFHDKESAVQNSIAYIGECIKYSINILLDEEEDYKILFTDSWYHIGSTNSSHETHGHSNCSWCGIFYLQAGDKDCGGHTVFISPVYSNYHDLISVHHSENSIRIIPEDGKLILFPSYVQHYQATYTGKKNRIMVGFNFTIKDRVDK